MFQCTWRVDKRVTDIKLVAIILYRLRRTRSGLPPPQCARGVTRQHLISAPSTSPRHPTPTPTGTESAVAHIPIGLTFSLIPQASAAILPTFPTSPHHLRPPSLPHAGSALVSRRPPLPRRQSPAAHPPSRAAAASSPTRTPQRCGGGRSARRLQRHFVVGGSCGGAGQLQHRAARSAAPMVATTSGAKPVQRRTLRAGAAPADGPLRAATGVAPPRPPPPLPKTLSAASLPLAYPAPFPPLTPATTAPTASANEQSSLSLAGSTNPRYCSSASLPCRP